MTSSLAADELDNNAFRFSIEWPRIFPRSTEGIDVGATIGKRDLSASTAAPTSARCATIASS